MNRHQKIGFIALAILMMVSVNAWSGHLPVDAEISVNTNDSVTECSTLFAGQTIDAGTVCYAIDADTLDMTVTYTTSGDWVLTEAHLWAGTSAEGYPQTNKGNPKIGNFPFNSGDITGATTYTFTLTAAEYGMAHDDFQCDAVYPVYAMAHAALQRETGDGGYQTETGWSDGKSVVDRGSWATQTMLTLTVDCDGGGGGGGGPTDHETAFGFAPEAINHTVPPDNGNGPDVTHQDSAISTCFLDLDLDPVDGVGDFNRWGWTNEIPAGSEATTLTMYAGAGRCILEKGTPAGTADVTYENGTVTVTFTATAGTWTEAHIYAGTNEVAQQQNPNSGDLENTVAPGQYTLVIEDLPESFESGTYQITGLPTGDSIYVIVHAVVLGL